MRRSPYARKAHVALGQERVVKSEPIAPKLDISKVEKAEKKVAKVEKPPRRPTVAKADPIENEGGGQREFDDLGGPTDDAAAVKATVVKVVKRSLPSRRTARSSSPRSA